MPMLHALRNAAGGIRVTIDLTPKESFPITEAPVGFHPANGMEVALPWPANGAISLTDVRRLTPESLAGYLNAWLSGGDALLAALAVTIQQQLAAQASSKPKPAEASPGVPG